MCKEHQYTGWKILGSGPSRRWIFFSGLYMRALRLAGKETKENRKSSQGCQPEGRESVSQTGEERTERLESSSVRSKVRKHRSGNEGRRSQGTKSSCVWMAHVCHAWRLPPGWGQLSGRTTWELTVSKAPGGPKSVRHRGTSGWGVNDGEAGLSGNVGAGLRGRREHSCWRREASPSPLFFHSRSFSVFWTRTFCHLCRRKR